MLLLGRLSETGAGWLGDAGEYCGETGENCDAGVLPNCEYCGETGENCEAGVRSTCEPVEKDAFLKKKQFYKVNQL